jgi:bis(5'-adenosyl)-triphosphatase
VDAGRSVPHVHVHVIPRRKLDYIQNDDIYDDLETSQRSLRSALSGWFPKIEDKDRQSRTEEDMLREATWLATFFKDPRISN